MRSPNYTVEENTSLHDRYRQGGVLLYLPSRKYEGDFPMSSLNTRLKVRML